MDDGERISGIPRASVLSGQGLHAGAGITSLSLGEQNAINSGIYNLGYPRPECSSANCTFAPYTSAGLCSQCDDISAEVQWQFGPPGEHWVSSFIPANLSTGSYSFEGLSINTSYASEGWNVAAAKDVYFRNQSSFMMVIGPPRTTMDGSLVDCNANRTWECLGYAATTCNLFPCIRNYTATMINGVFREEVANTWMAPFGESGQWADGSDYLQSAINKSCLTEEQSSRLRAMNYRLDGDSPWLAYNGSPSGDDLDTLDSSYDLQVMEQDLLDRHCLYAVDEFFLRGLYQYLGSSAISGNVTAHYYNSVTVSIDGPPFMLAIYNYGDISFDRTQAVWENISLALTNHMRLNPYYAARSGSGPALVDADGLRRYNLLNTSAPAPGLTFTMKTCLKVRWGWLAFPASLAAMTLVFFTGVLLSAGGLTRDVRTWKSSPLPLLFFGLSLPGIATDSQHIDDLDRVAKNTNVSLVTNEDGHMVLRRWFVHDAEI